MKIAIIGGGWVGCHLAYKLKQDHEIHIFEKNTELFQETSFNNQNRLHYGYHYARSYKTRHLCKSTFELFLNDYNFAVEDINKNIYGIPKDKSLIDYKTYTHIFSDYGFTEISHSFINMEGYINTQEKYINFIKISDFFNKELKSIVVHQKIDNKKLKNLNKKYDLVINATNNHLNSYKKSYFELTVSFLYEKIKDTTFDALTLVDGKFFSIYPYRNNEYTITDVEYTPIKSFQTIKSLKKYKETLDKNIIENRLKLIENKIEYYYPDFLNHFRYSSYFLSTKTKTYNSSDDRSPIIFKKDNIINCFTGKIQGIYLIEKHIIDEINNRTYGINR